MIALAEGVERELPVRLQVPLVRVDVLDAAQIPRREERRHVPEHLVDRHPHIRRQADEDHSVLLFDRQPHEVVERFVDVAERLLLIDRAQTAFQIEAPAVVRTAQCRGLARAFLEPCRAMCARVEERVDLPPVVTRQEHRHTEIVEGVVGARARQVGAEADPLRRLHEDGLLLVFEQCRIGVDRCRDAHRVRRALGRSGLQVGQHPLHDVHVGLSLVHARLLWFTGPTSAARSWNASSREGTGRSEAFPRRSNTCRDGQARLRRRA